MAMAAAAPPDVQSVPAPPRFRVAGFWRRAAATFVDLLVLTPILCLTSALLSVLFDRPLPHLSEIGPDLIVSALVEGSALGEAAVALGTVLLLLYFFIFHAIRGQTPGKRLLGVVVIDVFGERPGLARTLLRTTGSVFSALLFSLGFLWIGFDREKRALHDWLAGTYVVLAR